MMRRFALSIFFGAATLLLTAAECRATFVITVGSFDFTNSGGFNAAQQTLAQNLFQTAENTWLNTIGSPTNKNVALAITKVVFSNALTGNGATKSASADANGLPSTVGEIDISTKASMYYSVALAGIGASQRDAYSTMLHELGHAIGFNFLSGGDGYQKWNDQVDSLNAQFTLAAAFGGGKVTLSGTDANGLSHVDDATYPNDLMKSVGKNAVRDTISTMDIQMLQTAFNYTVVPEPCSLVLLTLGGLFALAAKRR
jgi:hypothetical protein